MQSGEFDQANISVEEGGLLRLIRLIDEALDKLPLEKRNMLLLRMGGEGHGPVILEEVGNKYNLTRERIRQIINSAVKQIGRSGGPVVAEMLRKAADRCLSKHLPIDPWTPVSMAWRGTNSLPVSIGLLRPAVQ